MAAGVGLGLLGLMLLYAALLRDRSRGRPRCPKCWYDMAGRDMAAQCPECGRPISTRRSLFRTRRRWWLAVVALVMLAAAWPMLQWERIKRDGWLSVTPTTVLIARQALRRPDAPTFDPAEIELWSRLSKDAKRTSGLPADHVWDWQWHLLYEINRRRASRFPDVGYFPVGREPRVEYGAADLYMMLALLDASGRRPESIAAFLERFGPELMMLDPPRERWPEGAAIPLTPRVIPAWGEPNRYRMRVEFEDPDMSSNQTLRPGTHYLR
ncbi:MAG: hypothetical protein GY715_21525, partial [Planctomycetes bacterium]|nr:hypothetical protein [Planctomycetota bacterium]